MQIEPPETIHFPIHSLQELQEQRGGLRVSALGSAAPIGARGVLNGYLSDVIRFSDEIRVPLARRSRRPTRFPLNFSPQSYVCYGTPCLGSAQNSNSGRLRAQILETLSKSCSPPPPPARPRLSPAHSTFRLNPMYVTVLRASEVLRIRILDVSEPRSSKH